jgi:hypothetical protein
LEPGAFQAPWVVSLNHFFTLQAQGLQPGAFHALWVNYIQIGLYRGRTSAVIGGCSQLNFQSVMDSPLRVSLGVAVQFEFESKL